MGRRGIEVTHDEPRTLYPTRHITAPTSLGVWGETKVESISNNVLLLGYE